MTIIVGLAFVSFVIQSLRATFGGYEDWRGTMERQRWAKRCPDCAAELRIKEAR